MAEVLLSAVTSKLTDLVIGQIVTEFRNQQGIGDDVMFIRDELSTMKTFLRVAEKRRMRDDLVNLWVAQVRDETYKVEDVIEEFLFRMKSPLESERPTRCLSINFSIFSIPHFFKQMKVCRQFRSQIETIRKEIEDISRRRRDYNLREEGTNSSLQEGEETKGDDVMSCPFVEEDDIVGIDGDVKKLRNWLLKKKDAHRRTIVSVVGMGGSGKTTLVKKVYNSTLAGQFECKAWVSVSKEFQEKDILKRMLKGFRESKREEQREDVETMTLNELRQTIHKYLQGKRYVLVLDDIWDVNVWEKLKHMLPRKSGGRVIFTTRIKEVASPIGETPPYIHQVEPLSPKLAWNLFCKKAFQNEHLPASYCPPDLKQIAEEIVKRCEGLPLGIVVIGGILSKKGTNESEWKEVLENLDWELNNNQDLERINRVFITSYHCLPPHLKYCFLYCGMFPEDYTIKKSRLIRLWVAEGFIVEDHHRRKTLEEVAYGYLVELINRSMLQVVYASYSDYRNKVGLISCRMHDLMRDIAIHVIEKEEFGEIFTKQRNNKSIKGRCRITIQNTSISIPSNEVTDIKTRSFLTFSLDDLFPSTSVQLVLKIKCLRVLDLSGTKIQNLPSNIVQYLFHLRYLSVKNTQVSELPDSLRKLYNLQTLDVRHTGVNNVPMFPQLRHLLTSGKHSVHLRFSASKRTNNGSSNLQTLGIVVANESLVSNLCYMTQLRKLHLKAVKEEHCVKLCAAIEKMEHLRSLLLEPFLNDEIILDLETTYPRHLENLELLGNMKDGRLPQWICSLKCLKGCVLYNSNLTEDSVSTLAQLPNLEILHLMGNTYLGRQIGWGGTNNEGRLRFPKLKTLWMFRMRELEEFSEIEEGMMPCLQYLNINDCPKLKKLPIGFQHLKSLLEFVITDMPEDFIKRLHKRSEGDEITEEGHDHWMIQHIPIVFHYHSKHDDRYLIPEILNRHIQS